MKLRPAVCLDCIAGDVTGEMLQYLGFGSTLILYGLLSEKKSGNIEPIAFIGKGQTIESFVLFTFLQGKTIFDMIELIIKVEAMYKKELKTEVQKEFGLHQLKEAIDYYQNNQTAGKILLKPNLTQARM